MYGDRESVMRKQEAFLDRAFLWKSIPASVEIHRRGTKETLLWIVPFYYTTTVKYEKIKYLPVWYLYLYERQAHIIPKIFIFEQYSANNRKILYI